jgi:hypothetical protein
MSYLNKYKKALLDIKEAKEHIGKIGKPQHTTERNVGKLHAVHISTIIYYQYSDGAKNYHENQYFDKFLGQAVRNNFDALAKEALSLMEQDIVNHKNLAKQEFLELFDEELVELD